ncbi:MULTISPECIES: TIGR03557 family F420-dependent LLM class oxidoreductase [Subtercola]|uniref:TIGR03557 family F420-dependent LLM class oxidoreductase n=1 Tax=Subtercola vilae TaxID=2056433 RepID=A0A4T2BTS2_9MICO|nr:MULTISPECIES: TIGR03557 family F420-dependent LLM class oxidoreductase [Subtercola]MEA9985533.1 TIGR03557 family F420-dependent LLM class oxidoreductase [Subtercola sp. RTI3]TIH35143.1 TIGR03557 family F420-dependent LLM class oxidoreductase [Subtercola vilae]
MSELSIGYAAMLEQFHPTEAVALAALAEKHGFSGTMATDHFQPWVPQQGQSSFVWNVLTALGERTSGDFGPGVTAPTFRWHPAMIAQASATMGAMYPGRHWLGLGSGEALNEHIVGQYWPEAPERINRMFEAVDIISKLFTASLAGRDVKHRGDYFTLESTRLWTMPLVAPEILVATSGPVTARRAGRHADGLITVGAPIEKIAGLFSRFADGAREVGKDPAGMPKVLQLHLSWAPTYEEALTNALVEWPNGGMRFAKADIRSPFEFEQMAKMVRPEDFEGRLLVSSEPDEHRAYIQRFADLGFDRIYLHNVGRNQAEWIETFGRDVLPKVVR